MRYFLYDRNLKHNGRQLRSNFTEAERKLWFRLKKRQVKGYLFNRQKSIEKYIVDFYCDKARLVIEIDGGQHCEDKNIRKDEQRSKELEKLKIKVLRFTNLDILNNIDSVLNKILDELKIHPNPPF